MNIVQLLVVPDMFQQKYGLRGEGRQCFASHEMMLWRGLYSMRETKASNFPLRIEYRATAGNLSQPHSPAVMATESVGNLPGCPLSALCNAVQPPKSFPPGEGADAWSRHLHREGSAAGRVEVIYYQAKRECKRHCSLPDVLSIIRVRERELTSSSLSSHPASPENS